MRRCILYEIAPEAEQYKERSINFVIKTIASFQCLSRCGDAMVRSSI